MIMTPKPPISLPNPPLAFQTSRLTPNTPFHQLPRSLIKPITKIPLIPLLRTKCCNTRN
ncbi:unnamed protein product [Moneuplotes crassus]|uniref:Uncharacterized protein n=1 Tax=Euplotes crassus TaxID=5936 RepID=A0AAD1XQI3_EUPCR|nr:unnamed protein product [Moneuplotes crassus]